ncbi:unnamed protein product [Ilex paraguariensis]|uniref:Uncharacterized protein n=1 Tax=Ilex paraguariensis TaxID=185542 RepID=A0ABC8RR12_9AQUA
MGLIFLMMGFWAPVGIMLFSENFPKQCLANVDSVHFNLSCAIIVVSHWILVNFIVAIIGFGVTSSSAAFSFTELFEMEILFIRKLYYTIPWYLLSSSWELQNWK